MDINEFISKQSDLLIRFAPYGLFIGCGGTSEFINYAIRTKPETEEEIFNICRQHLYYDTEMDKKEYNFNNSKDFINDIETRLSNIGYARVSFENIDNLHNKDIYNQLEINKSIRDILLNKFKSLLFDHSFVIVKVNNGYVRFESYLREYPTRKVIWNNWKSDITSLFDQPGINNWKRIFDVLPETTLEVQNIKLIINN